MEIAEEAKPHVLSVTQLNLQIHGLLEESYPDVWVEGEISDPRSYPSGHLYFTLKDADSQISAVLFKGQALGVRFKPEHGLQVLARGRVSTYLKRGQYQFIVSHMQPKAAGALQLAFEQLKKRLEAEGLFDPARKKPLPPYPERIGIVTSLAGAAIRDMLSILRRRFNGLHIRVYPVQVQGDGAAGMISQAIADFNAHFPDTEVLLVGRGGGSLEDLWAFNEETVARAIAASRIPIVSCVGHETDFTIADFVADLRAPTPSAAAELVVREREALLSHLEDLSRRLLPALQGDIRTLSDRLERARSSPLLRQPGRIFEQKEQRIDELQGRLARALGHSLRQAQERLKELPARLLQCMGQCLLHAEKDVRRHAEKLDALSPLKVLGRGYAIAFKLPEGTVLRSPKALRPRDHVKVRLQEGDFEAEVI